MRRQMWLQHNQAVQVVNVYGEALSGGSKKGRSKGKPANSPSAASNTPSVSLSGTDFLSTVQSRKVDD